MKFISILIAFSLIMLVVSSPLPKEKEDGDGGKVSKSDSKKDDKSDSKDDSKVSKSDAGDDDKSKSKDAKNSDDSSSAQATADDDKSSKSKSKDAKNSDDSSSAQAAADDGGNGGGASVLSSQKYNDFQISGTKAGTAEKEAADLFKDIDQNNLASVSAEDLARIKAVHDVAEEAEVKGFNPSIESAANPEDAEALKVGKTKNKVLKTTATVLQLEVQEAQGKNVDAAKLEKEKAKKAKNIAIDKQNSGKISKAVEFEGST